MIDDSKRHDFDIVLVYKFDRFSRNKYETTKHKKTLKDNGVKVVSATEYIPDSPEAIILESMIEGFGRTNGHNNKVKIKVADQCKIKDITYNSYKRERLCLFL